MSGWVLGGMRTEKDLVRPISRAFAARWARFMPARSTQTVVDVEETLAAAPLATSAACRGADQLRLAAGCGGGACARSSSRAAARC